MTTERILPSAWASALINGDDSGLEPEDIEELNEATAGLGACVDWRDYGITRFHDAPCGKLAECWLFTFMDA